MTIILAIALTICPAVGVRENCIVDGDTLWIGRQKVRLANIDTAELGGKCPYERALALRARDRLAKLLQRPFTVMPTGTDRYGRTLAVVRSEGRDVGGVLVREGLARPYAGGRKPWC